MNRVLLVRLGALGDVVHAIPVAAAIRRAFPSARIDWLVSANHRAILDLVPIIDRRLVVEAGQGASAATLVGAIRQLRRSKYDVAIDLQGLVKSAALARSSGAMRVIGFASSYLRERLARPFYTEVYDPGCRDIYDPAESRHVVEINLGLLSPLGLDVHTAEFPIEVVDTAIARKVRERTGGRYALLNPAAQWPNKRWPPARLGEVAAALRDRHGLTSVALWGPGEIALAEEVVSHSRGAAFASPPASLGDLVALARGATLMLSGDTGPTHVAAAVGTPIVALFGPTRPSRNGPWGVADISVSRAEVCRCHHLRQCTQASMCLLDIGVDEVLEAIDRRLAAAPSRG